jgi:hypothetical protein
MHREHHGAANAPVSLESLFRAEVASRESLPSSRVEERPKPETCITSFDRLQRQRLERTI